MPADGYALWLDGTPVLADAGWFVALARVFLGLAGGGPTGPYDARAGYAWLASALVPLLGYYGAFVLVNAAAWWAAAAATWWVTSRRVPRAAPLAGLLVALGSGFAITVGTPLSYAAAFALVALVVALAERLAVFRPDAGLGAWIILGWAIGAAGLFYAVDVPLLLFAGVYGLRRVSLLKIGAATGTSAAVGLAWRGFGQMALGLRFDSYATDVALGSLRSWLRLAGEGPLALAAGLGGTHVANMAAGAFPLPLLGAALLGLACLAPQNRAWCLAGVVAALASTAALSQMLVASRLMYVAYPWIYVAAACAALRVGETASAWLAPVVRTQAARVARLLPAVSLVLYQTAIANADLLGNHTFAVAFFSEARLRP